MPLESIFEHEAEEVRAWAVTLCGDGKPPSAARLLDMAKSDPSPMVRLALASALPRVGHGERWSLAETLASRADDRDDVYLPKMIWYGLAPIILNDISRGLALAKSTPMPVLADSIIWYLSKDAAGRDLLVHHLSESDARVDRVLELMVEALPSTTPLEAPERWSEVAERLRKPQNSADLDRLGGIFGDPLVLAAMRTVVVDESASMTKRNEALQFLSARGDTGCMTEFIALLNAPKFRSKVLPLMGRFNNNAVAEALLQLVPNLKAATYARRGLGARRQDQRFRKRHHREVCETIPGGSPLGTYKERRSCRLHQTLC